MTPYSRGYAAALKAAARECEEQAAAFKVWEMEAAAQRCRQKILSLPIVGEADQRAKGEDSRTERSCENGAAHPNPGEQVSRKEQVEGKAATCPPSARPGPSQECVSDLSERLRQYADIADAGGKAHWANAMREAMYTLAVYRQNAAKEEHDAPR